MGYDTRLILEVKAHPELYDNTHRGFKDKELKNEAWKQITYQLRKECDEESVRLVRMRWKSLRDSYVKDTKHKIAFTNGQAKPKKNWRYSHCMSFLTPHLCLPNPAKGIHHKERNPCDIEEVEPVENFFVTPEDLQEVSENSYNDHVLSEWSNSPNHQAITTSPSDCQENDIDSFFRGIADTVKKLSPINQVKVQRDIVNMVLDIKLKDIQENKDPLDAK